MRDPSLSLGGLHVGVAGASALAAALDRGALSQLKCLALRSARICDAALVALAPALRRRPALEELDLCANPFGGRGLAALLQAALPPSTGGLKKLKELHLLYTRITDTWCAHLAAVLDCHALPTLEVLNLHGTRASDAAKEAVNAALARSRSRAISSGHRPLRGRPRYDTVLLRFGGGF